MRAIEEFSKAYGEGVDGTDADFEIVLACQRNESGRREIGIGAPERPEQIDRQCHGLRPCRLQPLRSTCAISGASRERTLEPLHDLWRPRLALFNENARGVALSTASLCLAPDGARRRRDLQKRQGSRHSGDPIS